MLRQGRHLRPNGDVAVGGASAWEQREHCELFGSSFAPLKTHVLWVGMAGVLILRVSGGPSQQMLGDLPLTHHRER